MAVVLFHDITPLTALRVLPTGVQGVFFLISIFGGPNLAFHKAGAETPERPLTYCV